MILTNNNIYNYATALNNEFNSSCKIKFPVRVNFFLQKNIEKLTAAAQEIERARIGIAQEYGELNEDGTSYFIPPDKIAEAQNEIEELFNIEQDIKLHLFSIDDFNNIELTYQQMSALMFMIKDDEEE